MSPPTLPTLPTLPKPPNFIKFSGLSEQYCPYSHQYHAVLRHSEPKEKDDRPIAKPFLYDREKAKLSLKNLEEKAQRSP